MLIVSYLIILLYLFIIVDCDVTLVVNCLIISYFVVYLTVVVVFPGHQYMRCVRITKW